MKSGSLEKYDQMPVSKAVIQNALPAMAAMLMTLIYNLADTFFIGQTHDAYQVAAVSLATPVFLIFMALGTVFGAGGTSLISRAFGQRRPEYAKKICSFCMWCSIGIGTALTILLLVFMPQVLKIVGASEQTWDFTKTYLTIVAFCGPFSLISSGFSNILRAEGEANRAMIGQLLGNLLNMCLDPLFIIVFDWGITGCALATLIGETAGGVYYLFYYISGKSKLSIRLKDFTAKEGVASGVFSIGIPAALSSLLMSISQILMNKLMAGYDDMAVAGVGVAMKVVMITGMVSMGIGQGVQPLLGYCVGADNWERFKKYMKFSIVFATALGVGLTILCYAFTGQIVHAFLSDEAAFDYAVTFARIMLCTGPLFGIFYVMTNALQAMGAAVAALVINVSRQGIIYIPMLFVLKYIFGIYGLVWAQPVADLLSFGISILLYIRTSRKCMNRKPDRLQAEAL